MKLERCDMMVKNNESSMKDLIIILLSIVVVILLALYFYKWYQVKQDEKYMESYLINTNTINLEMTEIEEIKNWLNAKYEKASEIAEEDSLTDTLNYGESVVVKGIKPLITDYDIQNNFYYLNITNIRKHDNYKESIAKELGIDKNKINDLPVILYFKDGKLVENGVTNAQDFEKLLIDNDIKSK